MSTIEQPQSAPAQPFRDKSAEVAFSPRDYEPLAEFEKNGWMVVAGAPTVKMNKSREVRSGKVVNLAPEILAAAKKLSPPKIFQDLYIAVDPLRDQYVAVHKRTPLGESEWQRANR